MLTDQEKIKILETMKWLLEYSVTNENYVPPLCDIFSPNFGKELLPRLIPELSKKRCQYKGKFWWPIMFTANGKSFLKRYRALHETIKELETKIQES